MRFGYATERRVKPAQTTNGRHRTIDDYLSVLSHEKRAALQQLRTIIRSAIPMAEECMTYGLAAFMVNGRALVAFGAPDSHCALYPMSSTAVERLKDDLKEYDTSKGTVRFQPHNPPPGTLVRKLISTRLAENGMVLEEDWSSWEESN